MSVNGLRAEARSSAGRIKSGADGAIAAASAVTATRMKANAASVRGRRMKRAARNTKLPTRTARHPLARIAASATKASAAFVKSRALGLSNR